jgi:hypothetical protein
MVRMLFLKGRSFEKVRLSTQEIESVWAMPLAKCFKSIRFGGVQLKLGLE